MYRSKILIWFIGLNISSFLHSMHPEEYKAALPQEMTEAEKEFLAKELFAAEKTLDRELNTAGIKEEEKKDFLVWLDDYIYNKAQSEGLDPYNLKDLEKWLKTQPHDWVKKAYILWKRQISRVRELAKTIASTFKHP